jgi:predicted nucleic acid-binding protein
LGTAPEAAVRRLTTYLLDTCVLIDYLRDREAAVHAIRRLATRPSVSVITMAELYAGVRNNQERDRIDGLPAVLNVRDLDLELARLAGSYRLQYRRSHGVGMADALIAATARIHGARLVTRNTRHFPMLDDLLVPYQ